MPRNAGCGNAKINAADRIWGDAMRRMLSALVCALVVTAVGHAAPPAARAEFQAGVAAYARGDYPQVLADFRRSAAQGNALAETGLGAMYNDGLGMPKNYAEALKWYRLAAAQGYAPAETSLGVMYANGYGVAQRYAVALKWYRLAAAQGDGGAEYSVGLMFDNGQGVPQNYAEALKWYRLAAAQGFAIADNNLGWMHQEGHGVPRDYIVAYKWYLIAKATMRATNHYYHLASRNVSGLAAMMTPAQIAQAQREASAWCAAHRPA